jgi:hypothetical protein
MSRATLGVLSLVVLLLTARAPARADVVAARVELYAAYGAQLEKLAGECADQKQPEAAVRLRAWLPERTADKLTLFVLPSAAAPQTPADDHQWSKRWRLLRDQQAESLMELARQAIAEHRPSLAVELVTEAVRENPDHKQARRMLGFVRYRDAWHTPFEVRQMSANKVYHEKFGWLPKSHVARYEKGQRYFQGRWMTSAAEASLRTDIKRGWRVESEHYAVTTNHSLEEGVTLSRRLEMLYAVWQQAFAGYQSGEAEIAGRFAGRATRREPIQHNVVYFRDRQEYNDTLRSAQPQIEISIGIYFPRARTAYFFAGEDQQHDTLYHEATHQLFQETRPAVAEPGRANNFWAVEGIACYMESLQAGEQGFVTLGGANASRMQTARRLVEDKQSLPLAQFVRMGAEDLQRDPRIKELYGEATGLAHFFMHAEQGRYREPLVQYLEAIYSARDNEQSLVEAMGFSDAGLDRQYQDFMTAGQSSASAPAAAAH